MKKILCFLLAVLMILSVVACDTTKDPVDSDNVSDSTEASDTVDTTEKVNTNVIPAEKYDGVFKVGYARDVITPELPAPLDGLDGLMMTKLKDDLYATCVAVNDGENTALIYTVDLKNIGPVVYSQIQLRVSIATKVPKENIIVSATHNHSVFTPVDNISKSPSESLTKWTSNLPIMLANIAKDAIADMDDAEIYVGSAKTTGMAFIRRYVHEDGSYSGTWTGKHLTSSTKVVGMVADLDDTVQIIRFVRKEKKDVIMANWQAHLASARNVIPGSVTADMAYYIRDNVEKKDDDALVAFFAGASGNVNLTPPSESMRKYANYSMVGRALGDLIVKTAPIENLTKLEAGKINGISVNYDADVRKETADRIAKGKGSCGT